MLDVQHLKIGKECRERELGDFQKARDKLQNGTLQSAAVFSKQYNEAVQNSTTTNATAAANEAEARTAMLPSEHDSLVQRNKDLRQEYESKRQVSRKRQRSLLSIDRSHRSISSIHLINPSH